MFTISKPSPNRLDIELSGALDSEAMRTALDRLIEQTGDITHGRMLYKISDFEMPTLGAMAVELYRMPKLFGLIGKFDKCAVLSDTAWIRTAAEIESVIFKALEIKSFTLPDVKAAESWLNSHREEESNEAVEDNFPV